MGQVLVGIGAIAPGRYDPHREEGGGSGGAPGTCHHKSLRLSDSLYPAARFATRIESVSARSVRS